MGRKVKLLTVILSGLRHRWLVSSAKVNVKAVAVVVFLITPGAAISKMASARFMTDNPFSARYFR